MGRTLFMREPVVTAGASYGAGVLVEDERVAVVDERSFTTTDGLEVLV